MPEKQFVLDTNPVSAETQKIAEVELNETPERVAESIAELRRLLHENEDLHFGDDDKTLKLFLRPCHFYPESAIKLVSTFNHENIFFCSERSNRDKDNEKNSGTLNLPHNERALDCKRESIQSSILQFKVSFFFFILLCVRVRSCIDNSILFIPFDYRCYRSLKTHYIYISKRTSSTHMHDIC